MTHLALSAVTRRFGSVTAVDGVDLDLAKGGFLAVLGPSGCGKTTLLRLIAGFEPVDGGSITLDGEVVAAADRHLPPERRRIGMVFQSYALWPHMTVAEQVGYALVRQGLDPATRQRRISEALALVAVEDLAHRRPHELSGGQRQRVALARCVAMQPRLVLLDEPLGALDAHLKAALQAELAAFHQRTGATMVMVTHDQAEALALADRVAVMDKGRLQQVASPRDLYERPATAMVARFLGRGAVLPAMVMAVPGGQGKGRAIVLGQSIPVGCPSDQALGPAFVLVRPDQVTLGQVGPAMRVDRVAYVGGGFEVEVTSPLAPDVPLKAIAADPPAGAEVGVTLTGGWVIPAA
ncbi:MAG: ABC transporter ATP-binding protein [Alphaproteobacteria bacterium]|nr:ABC transporter ATP-binding protein [Alphaproteobacteria bacterium]TAD89210.1 MAG: ABC transporter ATP-binding protein [Alphaproteobacteria bacterium]